MQRCLCNSEDCHDPMLLTGVVTILHPNWMEMSFQFQSLKWKAGLMIPPVHFSPSPSLCAGCRKRKTTRQRWLIDNLQLHFQTLIMCAWRRSTDCYQSARHVGFSLVFRVPLLICFVKRVHSGHSRKPNFLYFVVYCWTPVFSLYLVNITWTGLTPACKKPPGSSQSVPVKIPLSSKRRIVKCKCQDIKSMICWFYNSRCVSLTMA